MAARSPAQRERDEAEAQALVARAAVGLNLTEHQRMHIANRIMLQHPDRAKASEQERAEFVKSMAGKVNSLPADVAFALEAIRLLADQGNVVAKDLFDSEVERLGLTRTVYFGPR